MEQQGEGVESTPMTGAASLQLESVLERAVRMFAVGADASIVFVLIPLAGEPSVEVCVLVKQAVYDLYESKRYRSLIGRSPERPDLRLSQEEALGYLLGAIVGVELLQQETRAFGSKVEFQALQEKKAIEKAKEAMKGKKKSARAVASKSAAAAAVLDATLEDIDAAAQRERAARRAQVPPKLVLPRGRIVEPRLAPAQPSPPCPPERERAPTRLEAAQQRAADCATRLTEAQAAHKAAQAEVLYLSCDVRRLEKSIKRHGEPEFEPPARMPTEPFQAVAAVYEARNNFADQQLSYQESTSFLLSLKQELVMLERNELDASNELECAKIEHETAEIIVQEWQQLEVEMVAVRLEAAERIANAPTRAKVAAQAVDAWGPDHTARPPTAVYDMRGPLGPHDARPPPEQLPDGLGWKGDRVPAVMPKAKQA